MERNDKLEEIEMKLKCSYARKFKVLPNLKNSQLN